MKSLSSFVSEEVKGYSGHTPLIVLHLCVRSPPLSLPVRCYEDFYRPHLYNPSAYSSRDSYGLQHHKTNTINMQETTITQSHNFYTIDTVQPHSYQGFYLFTPRQLLPIQHHKGNTSGRPSKEESDHKSHNVCTAHTLQPHAHKYSRLSILRQL